MKTRGFSTEWLLRADQSIRANRLLTRAAQGGADGRIRVREDCGFCSNSWRSRVQFEWFRLSRGWRARICGSSQLGLPTLLFFEEVSPRSSRIGMEPAVGKGWFFLPAPKSSHANVASRTASWKVVDAPRRATIQAERFNIRRLLPRPWSLRRGGHCARRPRDTSRLAAPVHTRRARGSAA